MGAPPPAEGAPVEEDAEMAISVLVVDDEEVFVQTLAKRLTLRRFNVYTATRKERVYRTLEENRIDVVLLDVKMPDLDGIEATRDIKEASLEGMKKGAFDYLLKPVNIDELVYKIEDAYRKKELQEEKIRRLKSQRDESSGEVGSAD